MRSSEAVTRARLENICGVGVAELHSWTSYKVPTNTVEITATPQRGFLPQRFVIPTTTAERWLIHDIVIGNRSQFMASGPVRATAFDEAVVLERVLFGMNVRIVVEYIGDNPNGEVFYTSLIGRDEENAPVALPLTSNGQRIQAYGGRRVLLELDDGGVGMCGRRMYCFEEHHERLEQLSIVVPNKNLSASDAVLEIVNVQGGFITDDGIFDGDKITGKVGMVTPVKPIMVSLRVETIAGGHVLFGVDERTGAVVFEVGDLGVRVVHGSHVSRGFAARCDLSGYVPTWWDCAQEQADG